MATTASHGLLGPPEIHHSPPASSFSTNSSAQPPKGLTENSSPTFITSGDPCLDFFFQVVPDTPAATVTSLLISAWNQDPLTALKLVCHLRGVRGTGKSDRKGFYSAALWLHSHHPKTLALNADSIADFGYMKDLLEILHRLVVGHNSRRRTRKKGRESRLFYRPRRLFYRPRRQLFSRERPGCESCRCKICRCRRSKKTEGRWPRVGTEEERLAAEMAKVTIRVEDAAIRRRQKRVEIAGKVVHRYTTDSDYRLLHDQTSEFFANLLSSDIRRLKSGDNRISLAAKWCPSLDSSYDRSTLLCEAIARWLFPRNPEYSDIKEEHYAYRVRERLRKEVLVPLRRALELPEVYIGTGRWGSIRYTRVASVAMKNYKKLFKKYDGKRFSEYLSLVKEGRATIAAGALLPHEILASAFKAEDEEDEEDDQVAELQWLRMVSDLYWTGKLSNCIAVCDVSGSMSGTPMEVCVALGLLISDLSEDPWRGRVITFTQNPQLHQIKGDTLKEKAEFVRNMDWGMNTDFQKVFDRILSLAVAGKLKPDRMVKRVFVFSDMEFDQASGSRWETDYEAISRKFKKSGYSVPEIVFWNLRDSRSTPVPSGQKGVALVSGFSKNLVKLFLEGDDDDLSPRRVMEAAIAGEEYSKLEVFD